ncbi:Fur-regulated basic protein FbpA [Neobacillus sp. MM2021_6]|uniref:Fur-regulated basic protein FbpA n=1 Tax=Bacillaceae TaxID=186817 RepID=UPI00140846A2|nr:MULTISPECIES: Fur-regulated basic protein FbpA [Bacillaceae]MBO0962521.1 Fur-regulated basic protein FbpA [Neobacillus sp. MM2021_6]NHC21001.1 Fur-regulated basic protein FbpA [Bacillus sp. MM2020_4]
MAQLREAVEKRKSRIIRDLISVGYTKSEDGRQLYELSLTELEVLHKHEKCGDNPVRQVEE